MLFAENAYLCTPPRSDGTMNETMNRVWTSLFLLLWPLALLAQPAGRQPFNEGWRFRQVATLTAREAQADFNDFGWRTVDLPHDWGVEGADDLYAATDAPRLNWWGKAWYRKHFSISAKDLNGRVLFESDGAMSGAEVWVNGVSVGRHPDGYTPFSFDITDCLREGDNAIAVSLDNKHSLTVSYPGGGLYRPVWLTRVPKAGVKGTEVRAEVGEDGASVRLLLRLRNAGAPVRAQVRTVIYPDIPELTEREVAGRETPVLQLTDTAVVEQRFEWKDVQLWSPAAPNRYRAITTVSTPYGIDSYVTRFGLRDAQFREDGLYLNGDLIPVRGVRLPHDLGALGAAWVDNLWADRLVRLKEAGCNAVSTDVPPAPELLDLCDRTGLLFVDGLSGRRKVAEGSHPCLVDGSGQPAFDLYGFAPVGSVILSDALFNTAGFPTGQYSLCRARWTEDSPMAEVIPHTPSADGSTVFVEVRTNGDSGVLYVNGRSQGFRKVNPVNGTLSWNAAYEPGEISVLVYRNGRPWAREKAVTTGAPVAVVWAEGIEEKIAGMERDNPVILRIPVEIVDADGLPVSDADPVLEFSLVGHGRIVATDAGDPSCATPFTAQKIQAFQGKAAVYIYKKGDEKTLLSVRAQGLKCPRMEL